MIELYDSKTANFAEGWSSAPRETVADVTRVQKITIFVPGWASARREAVPDAILALIQSHMLAPG